MSTRAWWLVLCVAIALAIAEVGWLANRITEHRARHAALTAPLIKPQAGSDTQAGAQVSRRKHLPLPIAGFGPM